MCICLLYSVGCLSFAQLVRGIALAVGMIVYHELTLWLPRLD